MKIILCSQEKSPFTQSMTPRNGLKWGPRCKLRFHGDRFHNRQHLCNLSSSTLYVWIAQYAPPGVLRNTSVYLLAQLSKIWKICFPISKKNYKSKKKAQGVLVDEQCLVHKFLYLVIETTCVKETSWPSSRMHCLFGDDYTSSQTRFLFS